MIVKINCIMNNELNLIILMKMISYLGTSSLGAAISCAAGYFCEIGSSYSTPCPAGSNNIFYFVSQHINNRKLTA